MNPKQKAEDLVNQFRAVLMQEDTDCGNEILCTLIAIKNAKICVEQILEHTDNPQYFIRVKQEIELL